jgi:hypothetical protein
VPTYRIDTTCKWESNDESVHRMAQYTVPKERKYSISKRLVNLTTECKTKARPNNVLSDTAVVIISKGPFFLNIWKTKERQCDDIITTHVAATNGKGPNVITSWWSQMLKSAVFSTLNIQRRTFANRYSKDGQEICMQVGVFMDTAIVCGYSYCLWIQLLFVVTATVYGYSYCL